MERGSTVRIGLKWIMSVKNNVKAERQKVRRPIKAHYIKLMIKNRRIMWDPVVSVENVTRPIAHEIEI